MKPSAVAMSVVAAACLSIASPILHPVSANAPTVESILDPTALVLDSAQLALLANASLSIGFHAGQQIPSSATIVVTSYQRIQSRGDLLDAISGNLPRSIDAIDVDPAGVVTDEGTTTVTVPTETTHRTSSALQFPQPGLYPVVVDVRDGDQVMAELLTFVDLLAADTSDDPGSLNVSVVASVSAPPVIPGSTSSTLLAQTLQALADLSAFPVKVPVAVAISPELLDRVGATTRDSLRTLLSTNVVLSRPRIPLDPSAAVAAGKQALFTRLLREGEDEVTALGETIASDRSLWLSSSQLTTGGAVLLRDLGTRLLVLPPSEYAAASGSIGAFTDTTQFVQTKLPDGTTVPTMVIDPILATRLRDQSGSLEQAAMYIAADLVAIRDQIASIESPVEGHTMIIGLDTGGVPNPTLLARVQELTAPTEAVRFVGLDRALRSTSTMMVGGAPLEIVLPLKSPLDVSARLNTLDALAAQASSLASMLIADDGRATRWSTTIDVLSSTSLTPVEVYTTATALSAEFQTIIGAVIPRPAYAFTLTGRRTTIRIPIENTGDEPLRVLLRLSATKLTFPRGDMVVLLDPREITDVEIPVVARSNGNSAVTLEILTPDGSRQVAETLFLKARVRALTGLAQMLTGGGLLALFAWWVHHLRSTKRSRRHAEVMERHPPARSDEPREGHDESSANVADS